MKQDIPVTRTISYVAFLIQLSLLVLLFFVFAWSGSDESLLWAGMTYLILSNTLRYFVPVDHRKGIRELKQNRFEEALHSFEKSFYFFTKHAWVDRFRVLTAFSASKMSFREMAMTNIAFTLICLERKEEAKEWYERCLREYPQNHIAYYALKMM